MSLTTICTTLQKYFPWDHIETICEEEDKSECAARIINSYFKVLKLLWPEDWEKGSKGVILTNNGFGVFMMVFQDIINHLVYKEQKNLLSASKVHEFEEILKNVYLKPAIKYLKGDEGLQKDIRRKTGRGPQSDNAAILDLAIKDSGLEDFNPRRIGGVHPVRPKEPPGTDILGKKAQLAEAKLRKLVMERLKRAYGSKWWTLGIPSDLRKRADERFYKERVRKPDLKHVKDEGQKFEFFSLGEIIDIVCYKSNWESVFKDVFTDDAEFRRRIKDIMALRNPISHMRSIHRQDVVDGTSGLLWLSQCLSDPEIDPYRV